MGATAGAASRQTTSSELFAVLGDKTATSRTLSRRVAWSTALRRLGSTNSLSLYRTDQESLQCLSSVKHSGLDRILRHLDDFCGFPYGLLVIVDKIDDFPMFR
jgi:hypothetical protein